MSIAESELAKTRSMLLSKFKELENQTKSLKEEIKSGRKFDRYDLEAMQDTLNNIETLCGSYSDLQQETSF